MTLTQNHQSSTEELKEKADKHMAELTKLIRTMGQTQQQKNTAQPTGSTTSPIAKRTRKDLQSRQALPRPPTRLLIPNRREAMDVSMINESVVSAINHEEDSSFLTQNPDNYTSDHFNSLMNESDILDDNDINDHSHNNRLATQQTPQSQLQYQATEGTAKEVPAENQ